MKKRNQIDDKFKWDLTHIYASDEDLKNDIEFLKEQPEKLSYFKGRLGDNVTCYDFFVKSTEVSKVLDRVGAYLSLRTSEDMENMKYIELQSIVGTIAQKISVAVSFEESELLSYGEEYIISLINDEKFKNYVMTLKDFLRNKDHVLSEEKQVMYSKVQKALGGFYDVFSNLDNLDLKFEKAKDSKGKLVEVNQHNYGKLMESKDRELRKNVALSLAKGYHSVSNTLSANYISTLEADWFSSDIHGFTSTLESELFDDNIDKEVYSTLIKNVNNNLNLLHKYYKLKQKALGLKTMYTYDTRVKISNLKVYKSYEDSVEKVINAVSVLGDEYVEGIKKAIGDRWIDVYPCEKKEGGGYCAQLYTPHPYILLNTVEDYRSIGTLAHELGHAMHDYLTAKNVPYELFGHPIFLAEIASTVNEILLFKYLYSTAKSNKEKILYLENYIEDIIGTVYTQTLYSEFEYFAHSLVEKGEPISKDILTNYYKSLLEKYNGKSVKFLNIGAGENWLRIPHFYYCYYVYKYATGMTSAINFSTKILAGDGCVKDKYLNFLKTGLNDYSINILNDAGVDLLEDETYNLVFNEFAWAINELEKLI